MEQTSLEELFIQATESDSSDIILRLQGELQNVDDLSEGDIPDSIEFLLESWGDTISDSEIKASFCLALAEMGGIDTPLFRNSLTDAIKFLLPPYMAKTGFLRGVGLRDNSVPAREVVKRYHTLSKLKNGIIVYSPDTRNWGKVNNIDSFAASVAIESVSGTSSYAVPLDKVLSESSIFEPGLLTRKLYGGSLISAKEYFNLINKQALAPISEKRCRDIAYYSLVPKVISTADKFEEWWANADSGEDDSSTGAVSGERKASEARSVQELNLLLGKLDEGFEFDEDDREKLKGFFDRLKPLRELKDLKLFCESLIMIGQHVDESVIEEIFTSLKDKCCFWPVDCEKVELEKLEVWGKLAAKSLPEFVNITKLLFSEEYLAGLAVHLPLRCLNSVCAVLDEDLIVDAVENTRFCSCDILLWIWKNRGKVGGNLLHELTMDNVVIAISAFELPKAWGSAQRELQKLLIDSADFQKQILANDAENIQAVLNAMQKAKGLHQGERQSLLVKLSRHSSALRQLLEKGEGQRLIGAQEVVESVQPVITSFKSLNRLKKELDDIVKIHIPENREALKVARAHGDFRENAEYDAAKERRDFLSNRRAELEADIVLVQPTDFKSVKPEDVAVVGSSVELKMADGGSEVYYLVGAWDGDPDKACISYKTRFGEALYGMKIGSDLELPDGRKCVISKVFALPEKILNLLAE
jgi:transcription elongation GreA/GreB family factor